MKQITCEMCGSTDLVKQDGVFVCQSCGIKYSVEEAKKMMVEGKVEVSGTVQVDKSNELEPLCKRGNDSLKSGNFSNAADCFESALRIDPDYIAAIHGLLCAKNGGASLSKIAGRISAKVVDDVFTESWKYYEKFGTVKYTDDNGKSQTAPKKSMALSSRMMILSKNERALTSDKNFIRLKELAAGSIKVDVDSVQSTFERTKKTIEKMYNDEESGRVKAELQIEQQNKLAREKEEQRNQQRNQWLSQGLCGFCGGQMAGAFSKKCTSCGKKKI